MTNNPNLAQLAERLIGGAVWAVSIADHGADHLTPRQIEKLYDAGNAMRQASAHLSRPEATDTLSDGAVERIVGSAIRDELAEHCDWSPREIDWSAVGRAALSSSIPTTAPEDGRPCLVCGGEGYEGNRYCRQCFGEGSISS